MSLPSLAEQILSANQARRREAVHEEERISRQAARYTRRDADGNSVPGTRTRVLQFLADGREHTFAEILPATGAIQGRVSSALCALVDAGRVERIGEKKPYRYRLA